MIKFVFKWYYVIKHLILLKFQSGGANTSSGAVTHANKSVAKSEIKPKQQLAEDLPNPIIRKFEKEKLYSSFKHNIWEADLGDILLINTFNRGFFYCYMLLIFIVNMHELLL